MRVLYVAAIALLAAGASSVVAQTGGQQARPPGQQQIDVRAIRQGAAELAEVRALLNDPDAGVRQLAMREIALKGSATQRMVALEVGLASADAVSQDLALRLLLSGIQVFVFEFVGEDGAPLRAQGNQWTSVTLTVTRFDLDTARFEGRSSCFGSSVSGQLSGSVLSFLANSCSASLKWDADRREFVGNVNISGGTADGIRRVSWRPA